MNRIERHRTEQAARVLRGDWRNAGVRVGGALYVVDPYDSDRAVRVLDCPICGGEGALDYIAGTEWSNGAPYPRWKSEPCGNCHGGVVYGPREWHRAAMECGDFVEADW